MSAQALRVAGGAGRGTAAVLLAMAATVGGVGWLYLLQRHGVAGAGPTVPEALPLQRLAGGAGQPVLRLVAAWLPAGMVAGAAAAAVGLRRRWVRAAVAVVVGALLLAALGMLADAVTASEPLRDHVSAQPERVATWLAAALMGIGACVSRSRR